MGNQLLDLRSHPHEEHLKKLTGFIVEDGTFDRIMGIYSASMGRAMYYGHRAIVILGSNDNPTFITVSNYLKSLKDGLDKGFGEMAYTNSTSSIAGLPLRAGVIRRKTKIAKLLKQLESSKN